MPPITKITKQEIIEEALKMTEERGITSINARDVAKKLGCSTQPIFSSFSNMEELKIEVKKSARQQYNRYIEEGMKEEVPYKGTGKAYIRFAKEKPKLFQLLFMNDERKETNYIIEDDNKSKINELVQKVTGLNLEEAERFHNEIWIFTHGIATLVATKSLEFSEKEIDTMLTDIFIAFMIKGKNKKRGNDGEDNRS